MALYVPIFKHIKLLLSMCLLRGSNSAVFNLRHREMDFNFFTQRTFVSLQAKRKEFPTVRANYSL